MANWNIPEDLKFTKSDEWVRVEGDEAVVGVSDYAQDQLSDIVYLELPVVGDTLNAGDEFGVIESVKASAPLKTPVGGEVVAVHDDLEDSEDTVNSDPYGEGWLIRLKLSDPADLEPLMDAAAYTAYCEERG